MLKVKDKKYGGGGGGRCLVLRMVILSLGFGNVGFGAMPPCRSVAPALSALVLGPACLNCQHLTISLPLATVAEVLSECRLLSYMSQMSMRMSFLFRLINIIHVQTLTQVKS